MKIPIQSQNAKLNIPMSTLSVTLSGEQRDLEKEIPVSQQVLGGNTRTIQDPMMDSKSNGEACTYVPSPNAC